MTNYIPFPNIHIEGNFNIREIMSPGDNSNENQNPQTFHRYCTPMKPHAGTDCSICMGYIENNEGSSLSCDCNANYHKECIFGWFRRSTNPTDQYSRGILTCTLCRETPTPITNNFDYANHPDEYIEPEVPPAPVSRSLFDDSEESELDNENINNYSNLLIN